MADTSTRDRILDVALGAYGTDGFSATSLDALADQLGVRKQTILYYFPSKQALFDAVVDEAAADLVKVFDEEASRGLSGVEQVSALICRTCDLIFLIKNSYADLGVGVFHIQDPCPYIMTHRQDSCLQFEY